MRVMLNIVRKDKIISGKIFINNICKNFGLKSPTT